MSRLESKGKGTFRRTKSGSIEYRIAYYDDNNVRRIKSFTADTEAECVKRADNFLKSHAINLIKFQDEATIPEIMRKKVHSDYLKNYTGEQGYDRNLHVISIIENSYIGITPITNISEVQLMRFFEEITSYSNTMIRKVFAMIRAAFKLAYERGIIDTDLITHHSIKCPKSSKSDREVRGLTENEQQKFIHALMKHKVPHGRNTYKTQLLLEIYTGMRMGEINALKPEDINFSEGYIHVGATISRGLGSRNFYKPHPKTAAGVRDVPMPMKARELLMEALMEMKPNPEGLIFYDHNKDDVIATYQVCSFYKRICEKAGIPYNGQHSLRHTFATRCIEADIPPLVLKKWLGHTDINITLSTYADVFDRMHLKSVSKFENIIDEIMS